MLSVHYRINVSGLPSGRQFIEPSGKSGALEDVVDVKGVGVVLYKDNLATVVELNGDHPFVVERLACL